MDSPITVRVSRSTAAVPFLIGSKTVLLAWCLAPSSPKPRFFNTSAELKEAENIYQKDIAHKRSTPSKCITKTILNYTSDLNFKIVFVKSFSKGIDVIKIIDGGKVFYFVRKYGRIITCPFSSIEVCFDFAETLSISEEIMISKMGNGTEVIELKNLESEIFCIKSDAIFRSGLLENQIEAKEFASTFDEISMEQFEYSNKNYT